MRIEQSNHVKPETNVFEAARGLVENPPQTAKFLEVANEETEAALAAIRVKIEEKSKIKPI